VTFVPVDSRLDGQRLDSIDSQLAKVNRRIKELEDFQKEAINSFQLINSVTGIEINPMTGMVHSAVSVDEKIRNGMVSMLPGTTGQEKSIIIPYTWAVTGSLSASSYAASVVVRDTYTGFTQNPITAKIASASYQIASGTNLTWKLQKNGSDLAGYGTSASPLTATTTVALTESVQTLSDQDTLTPVPLGVSGSPTNFNLTVHLEYTI